jgi:hypothetical protein
MTELQFPWRRAEISYVLQELSNPFIQWSLWIEDKKPLGMPEDKPYGFDFPAHFILSDNNLADDTQACLGVILKTQEEVETMRKLVDALFAVLGAAGKSAPDRDYITHPLWADVLAAAREALDAFTRAEYGYPLKKL